MSRVEGRRGDAPYRYHKVLPYSLLYAFTLTGSPPFLLFLPGMNTETLNYSGTRLPALHG
jgi:hypothetical protein